MTCKNLLVVVVLLSAVLGVDAARSARKTEKLYRKAGKWQRKLRDVWALLGVKPFLVQPGEEGDECVLKSKIAVDDAADKGDYMLKSTVEAEYVLKEAGVFTKAELDAAKGEGCAAAGGTWDGAACTKHSCKPVCDYSCEIDPLAELDAVYCQMGADPSTGDTPGVYCDFGDSYVECSSA